MSLNFVEIILLISLSLTLIVLASGIFIMLKGGHVNKKYGTKLMCWRVFLQGISLALLALVILQRG